jgi:hypothetical protein
MSSPQVRKLPDRRICTQEGRTSVRDSLSSLGDNFRLLFRLAAIVVLSAHAAAASPHLFRVDNPAAAESLMNEGGRLVQNYGSFQIIESDQAPAVHTREAHVQCVDQFNFIQLNARSLNTRAPEASSLRKTVGTFLGRRMHLVQFNGPVKPEWHKALEQTGARIVNYLPHNAYLVYGDAAGLARLQAWANAKAAVQWEGPYLDDLKIHPRARSLDENGNPRAIGTDTFAIQLVADDEANAATLARIDQWKLRPVRRNTRMLQFRNIVVALPAQRLPDIAAQPDVISIQPYFEPRQRDERQDQIVAGNLAGHLPDGPGYLNWLKGKGFTQEQFKASGFVVDVSDSGIDNGSILPCHFGLYESGIPSLGSRVSYTRLAGTANPGSTLRGCDGHGTLNAHIIAGYDGFGGFPYADSVGYSYGLGVCPFVKVGVSVIFDPGFTDPDYPALQTAAYNLGARISNNSWGSVNWGDYDMEAQTFDALVRDVGASEQSRQMVVVFAAGNDGPDIGTINSPATAKNVITVGASENVRSLTPENLGNSIDGADGCGTTDSEADSANDIADFSARGPCTDGRTKPDLVAPGTHVTGGVAQSSPITTNGYGAAIPCFDGSGVSGLQGGGACATNQTTTGNPDNFFPLGQQFYTVSSGTSHAAPAVSGACALLRQYFINNSQSPPSPAMTKAYLMNAARYLDGAGANDTLWSSSQGMGELDLGSGFDGLPRILRDQLPADTFTASGQTRVFTGFVSDPTRPLRITVAWTDAQGSTTAAKALVNDLDLEVTLDGATYKGNVFNGAYSTTGGTADSLNNVESVFLPAGHSNNFVVTLTAANIAADAVTNGGSLPEQDFALVIQNATIRPVPLIAMNSCSLMNESCTPTNGAIDPGETVTINLTLRNVGNADSTNLVVTLLETGGIVAPSGPQNYGSLLADGPPASLPFSFTTSGSCGETNAATFRLQDGSLDLGAVTVPISLGALATIYVQNFDGGTSPALPSGWTTSAAGGQKAWTRSRSAYDTPPYSLFSSEPASAGVNALVSPQIPLPSDPSQLVFRNKYSLEAGAAGTGYDGAVLEIKIGTGSFIDILDAGGSFVTGGYNCTLARSYSNPLAGRQVWSGDSHGFLTTIVTLPAAASGQTIQLRWRCGTDSATSGSGWYIDSVALKSYWCCPNQPPQPAFIPSVGTYNGLFHPSNGVPFLNSGAFSATTTAAGTCSGTLQMGATRYPFQGRFDSSGAISNQISVKGRDPLTLLLQMDTLDNSRITGTVNGGSWLAALLANRAVFSATANPAPCAGKYTLLFPGSGDPNDASIPFGDGYGAVTVAASGAVIASGSLADGTPFTFATKVSRDGDWPLYLPLYAGKGQVLGWLSFTTASPSSAVDGWITWSKPAISSARFYRDGFNVTATNVIGSAYNPLVSPITGFTNGVVSLAGGNLATNLTDAVMISLKNKVSTPAGSSLLLTLTPAQGFFKGTVIPPGAKKPVTFGGAILQDMNAGSGYCLGTNQSGKVSFTP